MDYIDLVVGQHPEVPSDVKPKYVVNQTRMVDSKDDRARLLDEGPAALPHRTENVAGESATWYSRELHDERSRIAGEHLGLLEDDTGD